MIDPEVQKAIDTITLKQRQDLGLDLEAAREAAGIDLKDEKALSKLRKKVTVPEGFRGEGVREFFRTYSNPNVDTEWPKIVSVKPPGPSNRALTQLLDPDGEVAKSFETMKWPDYVPKDARTVDAFNKWNTSLYKTEKEKIQALPDTYQKNVNPSGLLRDTGHSEKKGFNTSLGLQSRTQNQTTYNKYIVQDGDTLESISQKTGVAPKIMEESAANSKLDKQLLKNLDPGTTIKLNKIGDALETIRPDLAEIDAGGSTRELKEFKAVEQYLESFAPSEELSKYMRTSTDNFDVEGRGKIFFDEEFAPTGESARWKIEAQQNKVKAAFSKIKPLTTPSNEEKFKADLLSKNTNLVDTRGLQPNSSSTRTFFDRVKNKLQSKGFQREAARMAGQSNIPWTNVAGDLVGVIYDGMAFAADPNLQDGIDLILSGIQAGTSTIGAAMIAVPEPTTSGLGWVIMKAGDNVGLVEKLWNMKREGVALSTGKIKPQDLGKGSKILKINKQ